jgi:hypothetical protein
MTETLWELLRGAAATRVTGVERTETEWRALLGETGQRVDAVGDRLLQATCP